MSDSRQLIIATLNRLERIIRTLVADPLALAAKTEAITLDLYYANKLMKENEWPYFNICFALNPVFRLAQQEKRAVRANEIALALDNYDTVKASKIAKEDTARPLKQYRLQPSPDPSRSRGHHQASVRIQEVLQPPQVPSFGSCRSREHLKENESSMETSARDLHAKQLDAEQLVDSVKRGPVDQDGPSERHNRIPSRHIRITTSEELPVDSDQSVINAEEKSVSSGPEVVLDRTRMNVHGTKLDSSPTSSRKGFDRMEIDHDGTGKGNNEVPQSARLRPETTCASSTFDWKLAAAKRDEKQSVWPKTKQREHECDNWAVGDRADEEWIMPLLKRPERTTRIAFRNASMTRDIREIHGSGGRWLDSRYRPEPQACGRCREHQGGVQCYRWHPESARKACVRCYLANRKCEFVEEAKTQQKLTESYSTRRGRARYSNQGPEHSKKRSRDQSASSTRQKRSRHLDDGSTADFGSGKVDINQNSMMISAPEKTDRLQAHVIGKPGYKRPVFEIGSRGLRAGSKEYSLDDKRMAEKTAWKQGRIAMFTIMKMLSRLQVQQKQLGAVVKELKQSGEAISGPKREHRSAESLLDVSNVEYIQHPRAGEEVKEPLDNVQCVNQDSGGRF